MVDVRQHPDVTASENPLLSVGERQARASGPASRQEILNRGAKNTKTIAGPGRGRYLRNRNAPRGIGIPRQ